MSVDLRTSPVLTQRSRETAGLVLIYLGALVLVASSITKFAHLPPVEAQLTTAEFGGQKILLVASLEILSAALFLVPKTRSIGILVISAFLGAAFAAHVETGEYASGVAPAMLLCICWLGAWLRCPKVLWSLDRDAVTRK